MIKPKLEYAEENAQEKTCVEIRKNIENSN